jgi:hypothetical protein
MSDRPIGFMLLVTRARSGTGPNPAFRSGSTAGFEVMADAGQAADLAAQLNGTSSSGQFPETVAAYREA